MADLSVDNFVGSDGDPAPFVGAAPAVCRGDDLAAAFRAREIDQYEVNVLESGCRANILKSYRSKDAFILSEKTFIATSRRSRPIDEAPPERGFRCGSPSTVAG